MDVNVVYADRKTLIDVVNALDLQDLFSSDVSCYSTNQIRNKLLENDIQLVTL